MTDFTSVLLVEAAAGTGKTSLMAGRVAMMLASGYLPEDIAAITFTELAASQLASRIKEVVDALLAGEVPAFIRPALPNGLTPQQRAALAGAAPRLDELTATTIHGFCQAVIHSHGVQAGLDPGARIVDETVADTLFLGELTAWFSRRLAADAIENDPIVVLAEQIPLQVIGLIRELATLRREHPEATPISPQQNARPAPRMLPDEMPRALEGGTIGPAGLEAQRLELGTEHAPDLADPFEILRAAVDVDDAFEEGERLRVVRVDEADERPLVRRRRCLDERQPDDQRGHDRRRECNWIGHESESPG